MNEEAIALAKKQFPAWTLRKNGNLITPLFRAAFVTLEKPKAFGDNPEGEKKYSLSMIFDKGTEHTMLKQYIERIAKEQWADKWSKIISAQEAGTKRIFKDGSEMVEKGFAGFIEGVPYLAASNKEKPSLVSTDRAPDGSPMIISEEGVFFSGCYGIAALKPYCWDNKFGKGVSLSLQNVQMLVEGERLGGGRTKASEDFEAAEGDEVGEVSGATVKDPWE